MMQTFLFSDIEGSTRLWEADRNTMSVLLELHDRILKDIISRHRGNIVKHTGDGVFAVFGNGTDALSCAIELQREFHGEDFLARESNFQVRMGLHTGSAEKRGNDYFGPVVNLTQRVMDAGVGGQILVTGDFVESCGSVEPVELKDLGVQRLRDLSDPLRIFLVVHPDLPELWDISLKTLSCVPNNLQRPLTPFIGRERESHEIGRLLRDDGCRLLTLHGPGGTGKTRLSLQAAAGEIITFPDGVYFIQLDRIHSADLIPQVIAEVLQLDPGSVENLEDHIIDYLSRRRVLLVLDNYEHLSPSMDFLQRLIGETLDVSVLVTSRERLRLSSEHVLEIRGLGLPGEKENEGRLSDSEKLYNETALRISGRESSGRGSKKAVAEICGMFRGNPLALILAASWDGILDPPEILEELKISLSISSNLSDLPERHMSLRAVFLFSWNTLSADEKHNLAALTCFSDSFTRQASDRVSGISVMELASLVSKSLVEKHEDGTFSIHSLIREFAVEKFTEIMTKGMIEELSKRHSDYFLHLIAERSEDLQHGDRSSAAGELTGSMNDILIAWRSALEVSDTSLLNSSCQGIRILLGLKGMYAEGESLFGTSAEILGEPDNSLKRILLAWLLACRGWFSSYCRNGETSIRQLNTATDIFRKADDLPGLADSLNMLGNVYYVSGEYDAAFNAYNESLSIKRGMEDTPGIGAILNNLGNLAYQKMDYSGAERCYRESLEIDRRLGNQHGVSSSLSNLAIVAINVGHQEEAEVYLEEALELEIEIGDMFNIAMVQGVLCELLLRRRDFPRAEVLLEENITICEDLGNAWGVASACCTMGELRTAQDRFTDAAGMFVRAIDTIEGRNWIPLMLLIMGKSAMLMSKTNIDREALEIAEFVMDHRSCEAELKAEMMNMAETLAIPGNADPDGFHGDLTEMLQSVHEILKRLR